MARYYDDEILAYFLNRLYDNLPSASKIEFEKRNIIYIVKASALGLKKGVWPILGNWGNWNRDEWNVPPFFKKDLIDHTKYKIFYDVHLKFIKQEAINESEDFSTYPADGVAGYGFVEKRLLRLLEKFE